MGVVSTCLLLTMTKRPTPNKNTLLMCVWILLDTRRLDAPPDSDSSSISDFRGQSSKATLKGHLARRDNEPKRALIVEERVGLDNQILHRGRGWPTVLARFWIWILIVLGAWSYDHHQHHPGIWEGAHPEMHRCYEKKAVSPTGCCASISTNTWLVLR